MSNEFSVTDIAYLHYPNHVRIRVSTFTPAHLTAYHTDIPPLRHKLSRNLRGVLIDSGAYWCFVAYQNVEQDESGDTLLHTFTIPNWSFCQTRYTLFQGTVNGIDSPSMSPYFKHHHNNDPPSSVVLRPIAAGFQCSIMNGVPAACPDHWQNVNDSTPDEDASNINSRFVVTTPYRRDSYIKQNIIIAPTTIVTLDLTLRLRRQGGFAFVNLAQHVLRSPTLIHRSPVFNIPSTSYSDFTEIYNINPFTGWPWTWTELLALEIGLGIRSLWGVGFASYALCTQVYLTVNLDFPF